MSINYNPRIVTDGLVLCLDAGNTKSYPGSGTTWTDISRNGNDGTLTNGPTYSSANGGSLVFDGSNEYITIPDSNTLTNTSTLTINCWVKVNAFIGSYNAIVGKGTSDTDEEYVVAISSSSLYFDVGGGGPYTQPSYTFNTNTWYNICCVHSRTDGVSSLLCYVNGIILNNTVIQSTLTPNDNSLPVSIGSRYYNAAQSPFNGKISNVSIYNRALSAAEVAQNYNALAPRYSRLSIVSDGLVLNLDAGNYSSYPGSGTTWTNTSTSGSSFTLTNSPTYSNGSFTFDGVNDYAVSTTSNFLKWQNWTKLSFTIVFKHISATGQTNNRQYLFDFRTNGGSNGLFALIVDNPSTTRELTLSYNTTGTSFEEPIVYTYGFNEWIVYTFTFDKTSSSNNIRHYINGENVFNRSVTANSTATNGDGSIWIARYSVDNYHFNGSISHISANTGIIFTENQVQQNFNALRGRFGI